MDYIAPVLGWLFFGGVYAWILSGASKQKRKIWIYIIILVLGPLGILGLIVLFIIFIVKFIKKRLEKKEELSPGELKKHEKWIKRRAVIIPVLIAITILLIFLIIHGITGLSFSSMIRDFRN